MKKLIILLTLMVMVTGVVGAADFRDVNWGMTRDEVISREGTPAFEQDNLVAYEVELFGAEFALGFLFYENTLTDARYMLMEDLPGTEYKRLVENVNSGLTKKYGKPDGSGIIWFDDTYKGVATDFDLAISVGDVMVDYEYEGENTSVYFGVMGEDYKDDFFIFYKSTDPKHLKMIEQREEDKKSRSESQL